MRLFTAIDLPAEMLEKLREFLDRLRPLAKLRWSPVENLHITTKFIGEWPEARIHEMIAALRGVNGQPIKISVCGLGWFPDLRRKHIFFAGVHAGEPLAMLARSTEQAVAALGVRVDTRLYSPHLTLARVKDSVPMDDLLSAIDANDGFGSFVASSFFLYLSSNGKYSKLAEFSLNS